MLLFVNLFELNFSLGDYPMSTSFFITSTPELSRDFFCSLAKVCSAVPLHAITYLICIQESILTTREAAWYIISVVSVCLSVCQTITFEWLDVGSLRLHIQYCSREYGSGSYMKVIGSGQGYRNQKALKSLFPQCKTLQTIAPVL